MPQINRYTEMPQPLRLNPLSFEELSRIPLAKAQAQAEGVAALGRIKTDFNVDDKDLGYVTGLVGDIDATKNKVVDDIASGGINTQTVADVLNLKKKRDEVYKSKINQAEENKKRIDLWKQQVDQLYSKDAPWFGNLVKEKELNQGWAGTFNENGTPVTFDKGFGEKYIDMEKDISDELFRASSKGWEKTTPLGGGKPTFEQITNPNTGEIETLFTTPSEGSRTQASNKANLEATIKMLESEYNDTNTERGKFSAYAGIPKEQIKGIIDKYKDMYLDTKDVTHMSSKTRQLMDRGKGKEDVPTTPTYMTQEYRQSTYKLLDKLSNTGTGTYFVKNAWKEAGDVVENMTTKERNESGTGGGKELLMGVLGFGVKVQKFLRKMTGLDQTEPVSTEDQIDVINRFNSVAEMLVSNGTISKEGLNLARKAKGEVGNRWREKVLENILDYTSDNLAPMEQPVLNTSDNLTTTFGLENKGVKPEKAAQDILYGAPNFVKFDTREVIDAKKGSSEHAELKKIISDGKAKVQGSIPMLSPDLLDSNGNYMEGMSSALGIMNEDTKSKNYGKKYYAKLPKYLTDTDEFKRIEGVNKSVMSLPVGGDTNMIINNESGLPEGVTVMHELAPNKDGKLVAGNYFIYRYDESGNVVSRELLNNSPYLSRIKDLDYARYELSKPTK